MPTVLEVRSLRARYNSFVHIKLQSNNWSEQETSHVDTNKESQKEGVTTVWKNTANPTFNKQFFFYLNASIGNSSPAAQILDNFHILLLNQPFFGRPELLGDMHLVLSDYKPEVWHQINAKVRLKFLLYYMFLFLFIALTLLF